MSDAYSEWLDIPANLRPPTHYQLLGIAPSELDRSAVAAAAERRLAQLQSHRAGCDTETFRRIEREIKDARDTILDPVARQRYDLITPDATNPWWKPEPEPAAPVAVEGWWQPNGAAPAKNATTLESPAVAVPAEGWWQGEGADPGPAPILPQSSEPPAPTPAESTPSIFAAPGGELSAASRSDMRPRPQFPAKSDDWWMKPADELPVSAPVPPVPQSPPSAIERQPLPNAVAIPQAVASSPLVSERAMTYATPKHANSPALWIAGGVAGIVLVAIGVLLWKKPWETKEQPIAATDSTLVPSTVGTKKDERPIVAAPAAKKTNSQAIAVVPKVVEPSPPNVAKVDPPPKKDPKPPPATSEPFAPTTFRGHQGAVYSLAVSRDGKTMVSISDDRKVLKFSTRDNSKHEQIRLLLSPGVGVALCNGDRDVAFCDGGDVFVFDLAGQKMKASFENPRGGLRSLAAASDGSFVLTGTTDGCVRWWSVASGNLAHTLDVDDKATVTAVAISSDARTAALGLSDGRLCVWDLQKQREVKRWKGHKGMVTAVAISPDGKRFASAGDDNLANVWHLNGSLVHKLSGHEAPILAVAWCSDNQRVATAGVDKRINLWDEAKGWKSQWSTTAADKVFSLAIDSRDRFILIGQSNGVIQLLPLPAPAKGDN